jgi:phage portal protein BeeE
MQANNMAITPLNYNQNNKKYHQKKKDHIDKALLIINPFVNLN